MQRKVLMDVRITKNEGNDGRQLPSGLLNILIWWYFVVHNMYIPFEYFVPGCDLCQNHFQRDVYFLHHSRRYPGHNIFIILKQRLKYLHNMILGRKRPITQNY